MACLYFLSFLVYIYYLQVHALEERKEPRNEVAGASSISFPEPANPWEGNGGSGIIRDRHKTVCRPYCACVGNK